ncbi:hypothetical protein Tco_0499322 [Tanacetum coccineum]
MQEPSKSTPTISLQLPSQVKGQGSKDKGKAKMIELEKPLKKKDQIKFDEEEALRLQAKFDEEDRLAREKLVEGTEMEESSKKTEVMEKRSLKRAGDELQQESTKKQKMDDDQARAELQSLMNVIPDEDEVAVDAIPLAPKPPSIILRSFNREDLETLWKLVKAKHGYTRPEEGYERVIWGDLKTMFKHHVEDAVWRNLRESKVLVWKLFDSYGVHFVRFQNLHVFMLVEKRYPLTPTTIIDILNKKLQVDHLNEMCYQLLKLITKQLKNQ